MILKMPSKIWDSNSVTWGCSWNSSQPQVHTSLLGLWSVLTLVNLQVKSPLVPRGVGTTMIPVSRTHHLVREMVTTGPDGRRGRRTVPGGCLVMMSMKSDRDGFSGVRFLVLRSNWWAERGCYFWLFETMISLLWRSQSPQSESPCDVRESEAALQNPLIVVFMCLD